MSIYIQYIQGQIFQVSKSLVKVKVKVFNVQSKLKTKVQSQLNKEVKFVSFRKNFYTTAIYMHLIIFL